FLNFEDPRLSPALDHRTLDVMVKAFEADRGTGCTYFLDEIQWVTGWQRWLRVQLDRPKDRRFVVTGSNAHLLSGELGSTLTGRHHTVELFPFDLAEYRQLRPRATLTEYLDAGGFPATVASPDRDMLLRGYFSDIVERDMRERVSARSSVPLRKLVQMLFESAGSETSTRRLAAALGLAPDTAGAYIDAAVAQPRSGVSSSPSTAEALLSVPPIRRLARIVIRSAFTPATFGELLSSAFAVTSAVTPTLVTGYAASAQLRDWDLALLGIIRDSAKNSLPDSLANLTAAAGEPPTLILWGEADSWVPLRSGEVLRADLPAAEWVVLPGIGHVPFEEDVPTFIGVVGGWLDALR
ncbi:MAG: hypothetical protein EBZ91_13050, partial [Gammaproteobacteria bacterium]|nr:hypothetical protein [Gammaproteobacteria bacterium]